MAQRGGKRPGAGRKKGSRDRAPRGKIMALTELAQSHADVAIAALVQIATSGESEAARVSAANAILDRGYGRPPQSVELGGPGGGPIVSRVEIVPVDGNGED
jgi:hypothetical protein